jgi:anti-anti-sigma regulatory factor
MRRAGSITAPNGLSAGDHVCWAYGGSAGRLDSVVTEYLSEGAQGGDRLFYIGDASAEQLERDLERLPGRDEKLSSGQLVIVPLREQYAAFEQFDAREQAEVFRRAGEQARADGYRGLRAAADITALAEVAEGASPLLTYEAVIDATIADAGLTGMCLYDETRVGAHVSSIACLHPLRHRDLGDAPFSVHVDGGVIRLTGEVDTSSCDELATGLDTVAASASAALTIDLSDLEFIDVGATRQLAQRVVVWRASGRPVVFKAPRPTAATVMESFGIQSQPAA